MRDTGAEILHDGEERGRSKLSLSPPLQLPKNRSTGNLAASGDTSDKARMRFSFDAGAAAADYDALTRAPIMTDHDHGLGLSGLRRIRQQHNPHRPSQASQASQPASRSSSIGLTRTSSLNVIADPANGQAMPSSPGPGSPAFVEDLSRFPSESLHSFSFAHQSEDFIHNRQNMLKRSIDFMKDRMGWSMTSSAGIASAQARATGDVETQNMLDLLARAQLVGAGNLPHADPRLTGPLSGPAEMSNDNVFEKQFIPRTRSPDMIEDTPLSPTTSRAAGFAELPRPEGKPETNTGGQTTSSDLRAIESGSENPSKIPSDENGSTSPPPRRPTLHLKRTMTDTVQISLQQRLIDTMAQESAYKETVGSPTAPHSFTHVLQGPNRITQASSLQGHATRWVPAAQAIFTTEAKPPWTILAANDLACLVFGVTRAELLGSRAGGITSKLLSKPNSRSATPNKVERRAVTVHSGDARPPKTSHHHNLNKSRGVLLCGDVVPIQKRNGATGSASLWVKEKRVGLIWVLEEIHEDVAHVTLGEEGLVTKLSGALGPIWGDDKMEPGMDIGKLIPRLPRQGINPEIDYAQVAKRKYYTCRNSERVNIPATIQQVRGEPELRVSSFPHIAGIIVVNTRNLTIKSSNSVFCGALFGHEKPDGLPINNLIPNFDKILKILTDQDGINLLEGIVVPEHSFRKASAFLGLREGRADAATSFLRPEGLPAKHRDGSELKIDVQMRVVKSEKPAAIPEETIVEVSGDDDSTEGRDQFAVATSEMVYALWITYSRHLHASKGNMGAASPLLSGNATPLHQPSPGQTPAHTPAEIVSDSEEARKGSQSTVSMLTEQLKEVALTAAAKLTRSKPEEAEKPPLERATTPVTPVEHSKKTIDDFVILEEMGQGAYGQVKLARYRGNSKTCVLKFVTKRRILVDTWTKDRRLGTVPLEIHVLDYLRRDGLRHPNIVEMEDFWEDDVNYYIEMIPHGLPGMDLFDYIELRTNMEEPECRSIFVQVARAIQHLHTKALVVHRDIKDENVILDGEGNVKLIDFGSATYIKSGPFHVFVGTIDYAAPEVLAGKPYGGKEQDVWALGILLYTIIYKENPFYSIDEIMDRDLRVPYTISDDSIDLIRCMLDRDLGKRIDIDQVLAHPWCQDR
ncbi:Pkinase-domain-containing protein [Coniochaeta ligniaria NRRL 30616]|uniref:non-specific serine/threonine protein kinase n=1 Tax=Coniochaeta ligniaria NRRL 30616 TaxID=1408157 RepID=A0A1J7J3I5_9PEZI|nr:Pkinase-domain-containing protein [Coniochaeta ligniaria NRRL 30616]